jgi:RNA polymerase sigma-70 factor (ECF subfamily)
LALTVSYPTVDELVEQVMRGDTRACRQLYDRYSRAMYNTALRITGNRADAEDVLQEAFTAAFTQIKDFAHRSSFGAWLRQITVYRSIGVLKQRKISFAALDEGSMEQEEELAPDENELNLTVERIKTAMATLPDGYRAVLSLHLLEGYDYDEMAEILDLSPSTIRTQFMRGKQKLLTTLHQKNKS